MKRNVKVEDVYGRPVVRYEDDVIKLEAFKDLSGSLTVFDKDERTLFDSAQGTHNQRVSELYGLYNRLGKALGILNQIEDPKIYFKKVKQ